VVEKFHGFSSRQTPAVHLRRNLGTPTGPSPGDLCFLTTRANSAVAFAHERMPVILRDDEAMRWLEIGEFTEETLAPFIQPYPAHLLESYRINPRLNNTANDHAKTRPLPSRALR